MSSRHTASTGRTASARVAPTASSFVTPHLLVMALVFAGAMVVGYLLLPDENERIAMLERDGHDHQALDMLEKRFAAGDRGQRTLFQLQSLYEEKGDIPRATETLELLAAARPRDANVQRHLAELYRSTQNQAGYIRTLEARLATRASQPVCKELIGLYRSAGHYDAEQRTLVHCRSRGYRRTDDIIRLAQLTAVDGNTVEAASLLRWVDDRRQLRLDSDQQMLFAALVEAGDADDAKRRAARWFKGSKDENLVLQMIDTLATGQRDELATELAREVGRPGDAITLSISELALDQGDIEGARTELAAWLAAARKIRGAETAQRFVRAALDAEDPLLAYQGASGYGLERVAQDDLVSLAEALGAIERPEEFKAVRAFISDDAIRENLLLAAAVEVDLGQSEPARQLLSRIQVKALDEWRLALWARLMATTGRRETAQQTLRDIAAEVQREETAAVEAEPAAAEAAPDPADAAKAPTGQVQQAASPTGRSTLRRASGQRKAGPPSAQRRLIRRHRARTSPRGSRWRRAPQPNVPPPPRPTPKVPFPSPG